MLGVVARGAGNPRPGKKNTHDTSRGGKHKKAKSLHNLPNSLFDRTLSASHFHAGRLEPTTPKNDCGSSSARPSLQMHENLLQSSPSCINSFAAIPQPPAERASRDFQPTDFSSETDLHPLNKNFTSCSSSIS